MSSRTSLPPGWCMSSRTHLPPGWCMSSRISLLPGWCTRATTLALQAPLGCPILLVHEQHKGSCSRSRRNTAKSSIISNAYLTAWFQTTCYLGWLHFCLNYNDFQFDFIFVSIIMISNFTMLLYTLSLTFLITNTKTNQQSTKIDSGLLI